MSDRGDDVLILGCQRSGTTLLRLVLGSHPGVEAIDESNAYGHLSGRRPLADTQLRRAFKVPRLTEQWLEDEIDDDTFGKLPAMSRSWPAVFVVRDPRDVAVSMMTLKDGKQSWIATWGEKILSHRYERHAPFRDSLGTEFERVRDAGFPSADTAALYWLMKNAAFTRYVGAGLPVLGVLYEQLVAEPEFWLRRITTHFGVPFDDDLLQHESREHDQLESDGLAIGGTDPSRAIDASSVGRYRTALDPADLERIESMTGSAWDTLRRAIESQETAS